MYFFLQGLIFEKRTFSITFLLLSVTIKRWRYKIVGLEQSVLSHTASNSNKINIF